MPLLLSLVASSSSCSLSCSSLTLSLRSPRISPSQRTWKLVTMGTHPLVASVPRLVLMLRSSLSRREWWRDERSSKSWKLWDQIQFISYFVLINALFSTRLVQVPLTVPTTSRISPGSLPLISTGPISGSLDSSWTKISILTGATASRM